MIPSFALIIGAMKCGTTTLYDYLAQHPQIAIGDEKEPGFFAFEEAWALGLDWYESKFNYNPERHLYALDASTDYTKHPFCKDVVERLQASAPRRFKLIYMMRNPLRRIESHAKHTQSTHLEVGRCRSPRESHSLDAGVSPVSIAISRYAHQIDIFRSYYDEKQLLLLTLEQMARAPNAVFETVCKFLGIDFMPLDAALKSNAADSQPSGHSLSRHLYPLWQSLSKSAPARRIGKSLVPKSLRAEIYRFAKAAAPPEGRFVLNDREEKEIISTLAPDLRRLKETYGIDAKKEWGIDF